MLIQIAYLDSRLSSTSMYDLAVADVNGDMADPAFTKEHEISRLKLRLAYAGSIAILRAGRTIQGNSITLEYLLSKAAAIDASAWTQVVAAIYVRTYANP